MAWGKKKPGKAPEVDLAAPAAETGAEVAGVGGGDNSAMLDQMPPPDDAGGGVLGLFAAAAGGLGSTGSKAKKGLKSGLSGLGGGLKSGAKALGGKAKSLVSGPTEEEKIQKALDRLQPSSWDKQSMTAEHVQAMEKQFKGGKDYGVLMDQVASMGNVGHDVHGSSPELTDRVLGMEKDPLKVDPANPGKMANFSTYKSLDPEAIAKGARFALRSIRKEDHDRYTALGVTQPELMAMAMYTGDEAYFMNAVLRGQITDERAIRNWTPWCQLVVSGLRKLPATAANDQGHTKLDPTRPGDARVEYDTVYRADAWGPKFSRLVLEKYKAGAVISEPGFLSTSLTQGAYSGGGADVERVIHNAQVAKTVQDLSQARHEAEALVPPDTAMTIRSITDRKTGEAIPDVAARFETVEELDAHRLDVEAEFENTGPAPAEPDSLRTTDGDTVDPAATAGPIEQAVAAMPDAAV